MRRLVALLCVLLVSCTSAESDDSTAGPNESLLDDAIQVLGNSFSTEPSVRVEREIALCMKAQGFEYLPQVVQVSTLPERSPALGQDLDEAEFAEAYGFGQASSYIATTARPTGAELERLADQVPNTRDNADAINEMSDGERDAWFNALYGNGGDPDQNPPAGCQKTAIETSSTRTQLLDEFEDLLGEQSDRMNADPRIVAARDSWRQCMQDQGHPFQTPYEAEAFANEEFREFFKQVAANSPKETISVNAGPDHIIDVVLNPELTAPQNNELDRLIEQEISIAVAVVSCERTGEPNMAELVAEVEAEFIASNRSLLADITSD